LAYQRPRDQLNLEEAANRRGALYSSVEGQQQGNLLNTYQTKQSAATQANAQKQAAIAAQIQALQSGEKLFETGQYDAAVGRASKAAAANPATGQAPVAVPAAAPAAAPAPAALAPRPAARTTTVAGRKIPVKPLNQIGYHGGF
jgi:peptidoglycan hydrolase CwlO-like protein